MSYVLRIAQISALAALAISPGPVTAQSLTVVGGNVTMSISTAVAGLDPATHTDANTSLQYDALLASKITVSTSAPGQAFGLTLEAVSVVNGTSQGVKNLTNGMAAVDLIRNITLSGGAGSCVLRYRTSPRVTDGTGQDTHTVTFTLVAQ